MSLQNFYNEVDQILSRSEPLSQKLYALKQAMSDALLDEAFILSVVAVLFERCLQATTSIDEHLLLPLHHHVDLKYSLHVFFWPAFYCNPPHEHRTWGVTGVLHNTLHVQVYSFTESYRLKKTKLIQAEAQAVGYLLPGTIHHLANQSNELSVSLHLFNHLNDASRDTTWYGESRHAFLRRGLLERIYLGCLKMLTRVGSKEAFEMIDKMYEIAPIPIKWAILQSLYYRPAYRSRCLDRLALLA